MSNSDQRPKVTVEDLLKLKRLERPAADFWVNFERELRQKQLSALVEKRAWWHEIPQIFARRVYLPIGATAILAFTLVSVRYATPVQVGQISAEPPVLNPTLSVADNFGYDSASSVVANAPVVDLLPQAVSRVEEKSGESVDVQIASAPVVQRPAALDSAVKDSLSARSIAANLAHLEQSDPELLSSLLGSRLSAPTRVQLASATVTELASLSVNGSKRNRLLAQYSDRKVEPGPAATEATRERISRRLASDDFNDHFSRIGLNANRVSLKF